MTTTVDHFVPRAVKAGSHNCVLAPHLKEMFSSGGSQIDSEGGKYGRMFPNLPLLEVAIPKLIALGRAGALMDGAALPGGEPAMPDNPRIPAGWTFFGQFLAHDITADRSLLLHHAKFEELRNFRSASLDLDCVYGAGPSGDPFLYDLDDSDKFLLGLNDANAPDDLPRNRQGRALVGDPRNDVHLIISQLHLAFLKFHNRVVDWVREQGVPAAKVFDAARQLVTWHYQWIVAHEFLPLTVGEALVEEILTNGPKFYSFMERPFIPIEFADAAYRFGHSQIRGMYALNDHARGNIFPDCSGTCPVPAERVIDWRYFFDVAGEHPPQPSKRLDVQFAHSMINLPESVVGETELPEHHSLAVRDLQRARALDLPSGEAVARAMGVEPLAAEDCGLPEDWHGSETPLLFYLLKEAEIRHGGQHLGEVGGRIVAEVLLSLIHADPRSFMRAERKWRPLLPVAREGHFTMADLLRFGGAV
jgi:hypothetical protein